MARSRNRQGNRTATIDREEQVEHEPEAPKTMRAEQLADELGVSGKQLRAYLRENFTRTADEKGTSWVITDRMARAAREYFAEDEEESSDEVDKG